MDKTFKRIIITAILLIAIAAGAVALVVSGGSARLPGAAGPLDGLANGVTNAVIDISGVKGKVDSELRARSGALAAELGISQSVAEDIVDALAIRDWQATSLPEGVQQTSTSTVNAQNTQVSITTYDNPGFVTVGAYGLSVTLKAPESAQAYTPFLEYLQYLT